MDRTAAPLTLEPHPTAEVEQFSKTLAIDLAHAQFIEHMRGHYVRWEHDYIKQSSPEDRLREVG